MAKKKYMTQEEMLKKTRSKMQERSKGRKDPDEFRCPKPKDGQLEFYFKVLPPLLEGEKCKGEGGKETVCKNGAIDELWYYENGAHYLDRERIECPRAHDRDECPMCQLGFDLLDKSEDEEYRKRIRRNYLASSRYAVNIYFLNNQRNPEELRGQVKWYNAPKTIWDVWDACITSDDPGDENEPRACGLFFHPYESTYVFKLIAKLKGDFPTYESSHFLANSFGPLVALKDKEPDDEQIEKILAQRVELASKFSERDPEKLAKKAEEYLNNEKGGGDMTKIRLTESAARTGDDDDGEVTEPAPKRPSKSEESKEPKEEIVEDEGPSDDQIEEKPQAKASSKSKPKKEDDAKQESSEDDDSGEEDAKLSELLSTIDVDD